MIEHYKNAQKNFYLKKWFGILIHKIVNADFNFASIFCNLKIY